MALFGRHCNPGNKDGFVPKPLDLPALDLHPRRKSLATESDFA